MMECFNNRNIEIMERWNIGILSLTNGIYLEYWV